MKCVDEEWHLLNRHCTRERIVRYCSVLQLITVYMWRCDSSCALYLAKHTHITFVVRVETTYFSTRTCTFSHCISFPTLCIETTKYTQRKRLMLSSPIELFRLKFQPKISKTKKIIIHTANNHILAVCVMNGTANTNKLIYIYKYVRKEFKFLLICALSIFLRASTKIDVHFSIRFMNVNGK